MRTWLDHDEDPFRFVKDSSITTEKGLSLPLSPATIAEESDSLTSDSPAHATFVDSREGAKLARLSGKHIVEIIHYPGDEEYDSETDYQIYHPPTCKQEPSYYFNTNGDLVRAFRADCAEQHEVAAIGLDALVSENPCIKFKYWQELPEGFYTFREEGFWSGEYGGYDEYDGELILMEKVG